MRTRAFLPTISQDPLADSVKGSRLAGEFLRDCIARRDSLDIVTIGDSNACSPISYGYTAGLQRVLGGNCAVPLYASPLLSCGPQRFTVSNVPNDTISFGGTLYTPGITLYATKTEYASVNSAGILTKKLVIGASLSSELVSLQSFLYGTTTGYGVDATTPLLMPANHQWMPVCVKAGEVWKSEFGGLSNCIHYTSDSTLGKHPTTGAGSQAMAGRLVSATFATGSGSFHLTARSTASNTLLASTQVNTNTGVLGYTASQLDYTSPSNTALAVDFAWDGANQSGKDITGPACFLWASVCKLATKGYSVSNLVGYGGADTTVISNTLANTVHGTRSFLWELRNRQIACGGSGRVLVWINAGVNMDSSASVWTTKMTLIVNHIRDQWAAAGGDASSLAFAISVSHPMSTSSGVGTAWFTERPAFAAAASAWATTIGGGVSVVDLASLYPAHAMLVGFNAEGTLYDSVNQLHLKSTAATVTNGYDVLSAAAINALQA